MFIQRIAVRCLFLSRSLSLSVYARTPENSEAKATSLIGQKATVRIRRLKPKSFSGPLPDLSLKSQLHTDNYRKRKEPIERDAEEREPNDSIIWRKTERASNWLGTILNATIQT